MVTNKKRADDLLEVSFLFMERADELRPNNELIIRRLGMPGLFGSPTAVEYGHTKPDSVGDPIPLAIREHHGFKWMVKQEGILDARVSLLQQMRSKKLDATVVDISEIRFFERVAAFGAFAFNDSKWRPTTFSKDQKRKAVANATSIQALLKSGIWQADYWQNRTFEQSLATFINDLEKPASRDYTGPDARERYISTGLSQAFQIFELGSAAAVARLIASIGESYGFDLRLSTYERYSRRAREM